MVCATSGKFSRLREFDSGGPKLSQSLSKGDYPIFEDKPRKSGQSPVIVYPT
jgi:hypothetical protein